MRSVSARLSLGALALLVAVAHAEPTPLTEHDAVAVALSRAPLAEVIEGAIEVERGRGSVARAYPNPELSYAREQTFGDSGTGETSVVVSQGIDLGGRRRLRGDAGDRRAEAARLEGATTRLELATQVRRRFHELLHRQQRVAALDRWVAHVGEALSIVARREQRGDAATYDRKRLERERAVTNSRLATERSELAQAQTRLRSLLGTGGDPVATGALLPDASPPEVDALRTQSASRPDLLAIDQLVAATALERKAASRWWVPDLKLEAGWKGIAIDAGGRADGYIAGVGIAVPLWDHSSGAARIAEGEARIARGRRTLLAAELTASLDGTRAEAVRLRDIALEFEKVSPSADLVRMASLGYEAGELTVLELLDSYRGAADDELAALDMQLAARRARIELDRLTGASPP